MEIHLGVIRDKQGIYMGLQQSHALNGQLAVCYNSDGKLIVKICTVADIVGEKDDMKVTIRTKGKNAKNDITIMLDQIVSIYPIRDFYPEEE